MRFKTLAGAAVAALAFAALGAPAQAVTGADCGDGADWDWRIHTPARYQVDDQHTTVVGLSEPSRLVTILAPPGCEFEEGDRWQVFNGYFSASGTVDAAEAGDTQDSDLINVEVPASNTVAGQEIATRLRVNEHDTSAAWEVDKTSSISPFTILRRTLFKSGSTDNRVNFFPEPYECGEVTHGTGKLLRASWSADAYFGYAGRTVRMEWRSDPGSYSDNFVDTRQTDSAGNVHFRDTLGNSDGPPCGGALVFRGNYGGNGVSSGTVSTGDRITPAP